MKISFASASFGLGAISSCAIVAACASSGDQPNDGGATATGTGGAASVTSAASTSGSNGGGVNTGGGGGAGSVTLSLPQFVHGAAYVDTIAFTDIPIVIDVSGGMPDGVDVTFDGKTTTAAVKDGDRFVATVDANALGAGTHPLVATAKTGTATSGMVKASLVVASDSLQFTQFASAGPAYSSHLVYDEPGDDIAATWVSSASGKHALYLARLDGAFQRIAPNDVVLNDPADEPLNGYTAFGKTGIGVVYRTVKPNDGHWLVKMRVVDPLGKEIVPVMDLTAGGAAFSVEQAAADANGFSAAWLHITPPNDPNNPPPLEIRFSRWDLTAKKLVGPITLDSDQPQANGSSQGPQTLEPLAEIGIACNDKICLVTYTRDHYDSLVLLNIPKLFLAVVNLATGTLVAPPKAIESADWDTQMFGHQLIAQADGSFVLVYTANDTAAAIMSKSPCDDMLERDLLFAVKIDATGKVLGAPKPIFDFEGTREYPRVAPHPAGFALFWEDQRSECNPGGHIRMATNIVAPDLTSLLDTYLEVPYSICLPPEDPTLAVTATNFVAAWSDNRHGNGLVDPKPELYFTTYWRK